MTDFRQYSRALCAVAVILSAGAHVLLAQPQAVFTTDADFRRGNLLNLNQKVPGQLQVNPAAETQTFPFIAVAASFRGTVVRIDVRSGAVVGEYWSSPDERFGDPSRTTIDLHGNVWAGNRSGSNRFQQGSAVKIGLIVGGTRVNASGSPSPNGDFLKPPFEYNTCRDRNRDGLIKTSRGLGDLRPFPYPTDDTIRADGRLIAAEDECILVFQRVNALTIRHVSVDA